MTNMSHMKLTSLLLTVALVAGAGIQCEQVKKGDEKGSTTTSAAAASGQSVNTSGANTNPEQGTANSNIAFELQEYNWGTVNEGTDVKYDFTFTNTGSEVLKLLEVKPGCGCTVADFTKEVKPGETGKIHAEVKTNNFRGAQHKSITVKTNAKDNPELQLTLKGEVNAMVEVEPRSVTFGQMDVVSGKVMGDHTKIVTVKAGAALEGKPMSVTKVEVPSDVNYLDVKSEKQSDGTYLVKIDLLEDKALAFAKEQSSKTAASNPSGQANPNPNQHNFNTRVTINTDVENYHPVTVNINGTFQEQGAK